MQIEDCSQYSWQERVNIRLGKDRDPRLLTAEQIHDAHSFATEEMLNEIHTMLWHLCKAQGLPVYERSARKDGQG